MDKEEAADSSPTMPELACCLPGLVSMTSVDPMDDPARSRPHRNQLEIKEVECVMDIIEK